MNIRSSYRHVTTHPVWLVVACSALAGWLTLAQLHSLLPIDLWWHVLSALDLSNMTQILVRDSLMPRVTTCYDNALAETINGLHEAQPIHRRAPWKTRESPSNWRHWNGWPGSTIIG